MRRGRVDPVEPEHADRGLVGEVGRLDLELVALDLQYAADLLVVAGEQLVLHPAVAGLELLPERVDVGRAGRPGRIGRPDIGKASSRRKGRQGGRSRYISYALASRVQPARAPPGLNRFRRGGRFTGVPDDVMPEAPQPHAGLRTPKLRPRRLNLDQGWGQHATLIDSYNNAVIDPTSFACKKQGMTSKPRLRTSAARCLTRRSRLTAPGPTAEGCVLTARLHVHPTCNASAGPAGEHA